MAKFVKFETPSGFHSDRTIVWINADRVLSVAQLPCEVCRINCVGGEGADVLGDAELIVAALEGRGPDAAAAKPAMAGMLPDGTWEPVRPPPVGMPDMVQATEANVWIKANVLINGTWLHEGQAMTLRVACQHFMEFLANRALGDDRIGREITNLERGRIEDILNLLHEGSR